MLCHVSHVYETGCSLYFTVAARQGADPIAQWQAAKAAASDAIIAAGATITHHHAIGTDHKPWFAQEIGPVGRARAPRGQGRARPGRHPQPRRAHPVTPRRPRQPDALRARSSTPPPAAAPPRARSLPVARLLRDAGARVEVTLLAGSGCDPRPGRRRRWPAGDVVVSVGGDGMLSSVAGEVSRRRRRRSACSPPVAATTSRGCSTCRVRARGAGRAAARRPGPAGRPARLRRADRGRLGVRRRRRAGRRRSCDGWRRLPGALHYPARRRPCGRGIPTRSLPAGRRRRRTRGVGGDRRGRELGVLRAGHADRPRRLGQRRAARRRRGRCGVPALAAAGAAEPLRRPPRRADEVQVFAVAGGAVAVPGTPVPVGGDGEPSAPARTTATGRCGSEVLPATLTLLAA